jgi:hypothetical protein
MNLHMEQFGTSLPSVSFNTFQHTGMCYNISVKEMKTYIRIYWIQRKLLYCPQPQPASPCSLYVAFNRKNLPVITVCSGLGWNISSNLKSAITCRSFYSALGSCRSGQVDHRSTCNQVHTFRKEIRNQEFLVLSLVTNCRFVGLKV